MAIRSHLTAHREGACKNNLQPPLDSHENLPIRLFMKPEETLAPPVKVTGLLHLPDGPRRSETRNREVSDWSGAFSALFGKRVFFRRG